MDVKALHLCYQREIKAHARSNTEFLRNGASA